MSAPTFDGGYERSSRTATLVVAAVMTVGGALLVAGHLVWPVGPAGDVTYLGALGLAAVVGWGAALQCRGRTRRAWAMVALGISLSASADLVYSVQTWTVGEPDVSIADPIWLVSYAALGLGLLRLTPGRKRNRGLDVDAIIDSLVPAVIALMAIWELALDDLVSDQSTPVLARAVRAVYPVLDVLLLALVVRLGIHHRRTRSPAFALVAAGITAWLAADLAYVLVTAEGLQVWIDVGWMIASMLLAGAIVARRRAPAHIPVAAGTVTVARSRIWLVMVPVLVPTAVDLLGHNGTIDTDPRGLAAATAALVVLAIIRGHRLLRSAERARATVQRSEAHYRALASTSADAVLVLDAGGRVGEASGNLLRLVGHEAADVVGRTAPDALACVDHDALLTYLETVRATPGAVAEHEIEVRHADGDRRWLATRLVNLLDDDAVAGVVVNLQDVTDRRRAQDALAHQAFHDGLTGLANHALFTDRIEQALRRTARTGATAAVLYLDVDGFKSVNDRLGHGAGDGVLHEVAGRLQRTVRSADTVARLGGDEFAVLIEENHLAAAEALTTAERILQALSIPVDVDGQLIAISASIGLATGDVASTAAGLVRNADIAMYRAKAGGKARIVVFDEQMGAEASDAVRIEAGLPGVVERDELELDFQPVLELATKRLVGFEALVRWRHPDLGLIVPDRFIPLSEATGAIVPIGRWVLERACAAAARWKDAGDGPPLTMAVNLSAVQLATDEIVDDVRRALERTGLAPELLVLEITESALIADPAAAASRLRALGQLGARLAIDDFGTGYSSLSYLRQFPIDILKIDRSFVETIAPDDELPPIIRGLLDLARTLDLEIIAEGIESEAQHDSLRDDCAMGQGFYFARPLPETYVDRCLSSPDCPIRVRGDDLRTTSSGEPAV